MFSDFHFLRPMLLLLLPVVALLAYWLWRYQPNHNAWQAWVSAHLQQLLLTDRQQQRHSRQHFWLALLLLSRRPARRCRTQLAKKIPQPAFQLNRATVLVMDMSLSMLATDAKPNRLAQAKFKALDFASQLGEGELALVSFAADAFVISPLTPDHDDIKLLLPD